VSIAALPSVDGRHRNKALAAARRTRAIELRTQGWTYEEIAADLGYANRCTVYSIVTKALAAQEADEVDNFRTTEFERLNRLEKSLWPLAEAGDVAAVSEIRRIIMARVRLHGMTEKVVRDQEGCRTVVCSCAPGTGHRRSEFADS
jgi:hypothetical protein